MEATAVAAYVSSLVRSVDFQFILDTELSPAQENTFPGHVLQKSWHSDVLV